MISWKLQNKFVERVIKSEYVYYDIMPNLEEIAIGDGCHYYVLDVKEVFLDLDKLATVHPNLRQVRILPEFHKMDFSENVSLTFESIAQVNYGPKMQTTKAVLRKFECQDKEIFINEAYLKEFDFLKYPEDFRAGALKDKCYKNPVMFEAEYVTAVILPFIVGGADNER